MILIVNEHPPSFWRICVMDASRERIEKRKLEALKMIAIQLSTISEELKTLNQHLSSKNDDVKTFSTYFRIPVSENGKKSVKLTSKTSVCDSTESYNPTLRTDDPWWYYFT